MRLLVTALAALCIICAPAFAAPALAAGATVVVPWGDLLVQATGTLASLAVTALSALLARWLPDWIRMQLVEQLLTRSVDYGLAAVAGATKGKTLDVPVANAVLAEAATYAVSQAPALSRWLGETLQPKLLARLGAAGVLPADSGLARRAGTRMFPGSDSQDGSRQQPAPGDDDALTVKLA